MNEWKFCCYGNQNYKFHKNDQVYWYEKHNAPINILPQGGGGGGGQTKGN